MTDLIPRARTMADADGVSPDVSALLHDLCDAFEKLQGPLWRLILADEVCLRETCAHFRDPEKCECQAKFNRIVRAATTPKGTP